MMQMIVMKICARGREQFAVGEKLRSGASGTKEAISGLAATLAAQRLQSFSDHYLHPDKSLTTKLT